jgi:hypothetical protein
MDGTVIEGILIDPEHPIFLSIRLDSGSLKVVSRELVKVINGTEQRTDLKAIYAARLAAAGSPSDLLELAAWCEGMGLSDERLEVGRILVEGDRNHREGNAILGRYRYQGEWRDLKELQELGALDAQNRLVGTPKDRADIRRAFLLLLERPPLPNETSGALQFPIEVIVDEILASKDHWNRWIEVVLQRFLVEGDATTLLESFSDLATQLASGKVHIVDAIKMIAASNGVAVRYSKPREFAARVLEVFLGPGAANDSERLDAAEAMITGERTAVFGDRGSSKADFLEIVSRQPAFFRRQLRVESDRVLGEGLERKDLTRSAMTLAANPHKFRETCKAWVIEALTDSGEKRWKPREMYIRTTWVHITGTLPHSETKMLRGLVGALGPPDGMRRLLPSMLIELGYLNPPERGTRSDEEFVIGEFRRILGRDPGSEELAAGVMTLNNRGLATLLSDLLSCEEFQSF